MIKIDYVKKPFIEIDGKGYFEGLGWIINDIGFEISFPLEYGNEYSEYVSVECWIEGEILQANFNSHSNYLGLTKKDTSDIVRKFVEFASKELDVDMSRYAEMEIKVDGKNLRS